MFGQCVEINEDTSEAPMIGSMSCLRNAARAKTLPATFILSSLAAMNDEQRFAVRSVPVTIPIIRRINRINAISAEMRQGNFILIPAYTPQSSIQQGSGRQWQ